MHRDVGDERLGGATLPGADERGPATRAPRGLDVARRRRPRTTSRPRANGTAMHACSNRAIPGFRHAHPSSGV